MYKAHYKDSLKALGSPTERSVWPSVLQADLTWKSFLNYYITAKSKFRMSRAMNG